MNAPGDDAGAPPERWDPLQQIVRTLVLYAVAEAQAGAVKAIELEVSDGRFRIADDGRGHAVGRTVDGHDYLALVYTHLAFPFGRSPPPAVQLQGLGISLINRLCRTLCVTVRRAGALHRITYAEGRLQECVGPEPAAGSSGNTIEGRLRPELGGGATDLEALDGWLRSVRAAMPGLRVRLNGREIEAG